MNTALQLIQHSIFTSNRTNSFEQRSAQRMNSSTAIVIVVLTIGCLELVRFSVGSAVYSYQASEQEASESVYTTY